MKRLVAFNVGVLNNFIKVISLVESSYSKKVNLISNQSIGAHVRHVIDFYLCFIDGLSRGVINYDNRSRNIKIENDCNIAKESISKIIDFLSKLNSSNSNLDIKINLSVSNRSLASTVERELMHIADHAVHHGHIIQMIVKHEFPDLDLSVNFYSPSTLEHMKCVQ